LFLSALIVPKVKLRWCCQANAKGLRLGCGRGETSLGSGYA
jgi:hypothetical protein